MTAAPPSLRAVGRHLPIATVLLVAVWPFALWLLSRSDPELAVRFESAVYHALRTLAFWLLAAVGVACIVFPPAWAGLRLFWSRLWRSLSNDQAPLRRAISELRHFESAARHAEVGRLARLRQLDDLARPHLERAVELDPTHASSWYQLGLLQFHAGQSAVAAESFRRVEELDPGHAFGDALLLRGRALHALGDPEALALLVQHQRQHGGSPRSHVWLADAHLRAGDRDAANAALQLAAAPPRLRLTAEENWFRAWARVRCLGSRRTP